VLNGMVAMNKLTQAQADAMQFPKLLTDQPGHSAPQYGIAASNDPWASYTMGVVANELSAFKHYTVSQLETGGYKIVTTIDRHQERMLYQAVNKNVEQMKADGGALPSYAMVGAELQNPQNGNILAIYPGRGQNMSAQQCAVYKCDINTAVYAREQVGSSFKPYVLAQAVKEGMNANTSILDTDSPLYVPPDQSPMTPSTTDKAKAATIPGSFQFNNDDHIGHGPQPVQKAFAISSNTAFTDLAHRVGTGPIINLAQQMGVDTSSFKVGGSGLADLKGQVGMALGTGALTINEQDTMLATITNGGVYHQPHLIASVTDPAGNKSTLQLAARVVMTQAQASQVQWTMSTVVKQGGTGTAAEMADGRPIIAKTGTTTNNRTAFFIGAIPQYALTVGIFTQQQADCLDKVAPKDPSMCKVKNPQTLNNLGGNSNGGFGGYWPARIWNSYAESQWASLPQQNFLSPVFTGDAWIQDKPQPSCGKGGNGGMFGFGGQPGQNNAQCCQPNQRQNQGGQGQGTPAPGATPCPTQPGANGGKNKRNQPGNGGTGFPTQPGQPSGNPTRGGCIPPFCQQSPSASPSGTAPTASSSPSPTTSKKNATTAPAAATTGAQSGFALAGVAAVLPGSLLWNRIARRRRRKRRQ
jgi:membrane peptidoglycan carboxypeptidase